MNLLSAVTVKETKGGLARIRYYSIDGRRLGKLWSMQDFRFKRWQWKVDPEAAEDFPHLAALDKGLWWTKYATVDRRRFTLTPDDVMEAIASDVLAASGLDR